MTGHLAARDPNVPPRPTPVRGPACRIRDCDLERDDTGFCVEHRRIRAENIRWCPIYYKPIGDEGVRSTHCAFCDTEVWLLRRNDDPAHEIWAIEAGAVIDGRCWIVDGGFRVVTGKQRDVLIRDKIPLFRTHPSACPGRPELTPDAVEISDDTDEEPRENLE